MRTEDWQQDQGGMTSTAIATVFEPGDLPDVVRHDLVEVDYKIFTELMTQAGYTRAGP